jgi:hypothetical protein
MYGAVLQQGFFFNHDFLVIKRRKKKNKDKKNQGQNTSWKKHDSHCVSKYME